MGLLLFVWFVQLESEGRSATVVAVVASVMLLEAVLFQSQNDVPTGLFRIPLGQFDIRPADVLIPVALGARILARPPARRISISAGLWSAFVMWYLASGITGFYSGNPVSEIIGQMRAMLLFAGGFALVSGMDVRLLVSDRFLDILSRTLLGVCGFYFVMILAIGPIPLALGPASIPQLGGLNADAATIISVLGFVLLLVEFSQPVHRRNRVIAGSAALMLPLIGSQAASLLALGTMVLLAALFAVGPRWRDRVTITPTEFGLVVVLALTLGGLGLTVAGQTAEVAGHVEDALGSSEQAKTSRLRVLLWEDARDFIAEAPVLGQGAGFRQELPDQWPAPTTLVTSHNVLIDVTLQAGIPGLLLFLAALLSSLSRAKSAWRTARDPRLAMLVLGTMIGVIGILAKGMVESVFDKFRLSIFLGMLLSALIHTADRINDPDATHEEPVSPAAAPSPVATASVPGITAP